jgi:gliding motility-associated-like protein
LNQTGNYSYTLQNICGTTSDSFQLNVEFPTAFSLGNDTTLCYGEEITKSLDFPNHTFLWNDGSTESYTTITQSGVYGVTIWTPARCESYDELEVTDCGAQLFIPNAFTPGNADDLNNTFQVKGVGIKAYRIVIYDRWGQEVFSSTDLTHSWDGTFNGEPSPQGMYSYKIWYNPSGDRPATGDSPRSIEKMGSVTVVR